MLFVLASSNSTGVAMTGSEMWYFMLNLLVDVVDLLENANRINFVVDFLKLWLIWPIISQ